MQNILTLATILILFGLDMIIVAMTLKYNNKILHIITLIITTIVLYYVYEFVNLIGVK